jgi:mono/diheme cytochrome c family protein
MEVTAQLRDIFFYKYKYLPIFRENRLLKSKIFLKFRTNPLSNMKKVHLLPIAAVVGLLFFQYTPKTEVEEFALHPGMSPDMPANVKAIVDQKCYGCHNADSKNEKGKAKLDWDAFEEAKKSKQLATKGKIAETLEKGEMPPAKFLESKPEGKLSEAELATLLEWSAGKKKKGAE